MKPPRRYGLQFRTEGEGIMLPTIQLNQQWPEKPVHDLQKGTIEVHSCFYTIQGEGPFAGTPAVFLRLAGCNLQCPDCDTIYADKRDLMDYNQVFDRILHEIEGKRVRHHIPTPPLIVITGGEPFRQNIWPLCHHLLESGFINIQIETNGTMGWPADEVPCLPATIVCSPKKSYVVPELRPRCKHLKYVVQAGQISEEDGLPLRTMGYEGTICRPWTGFVGTVWLQPLDEQDQVKNKANTEACVAACMKFGYRMSIQTHKILGVP